MDIQGFFNFKNNCPHCGKLLIREGQIDVLVDTDEPHPMGFALAGTIRYGFNGRKFNKIDALSYVDSYKKEMEFLLNKFPKTFSVNKKFLPRTRKKELSKYISPFFINSLDVRFVRFCYGNRDDHFYNYQSRYLCENEIGNTIELDHEIMHIHGYRIFNRFLSSVPTTTIGIGDDLVLAGEQMNYIPISKWRTKTKKMFEEQIENYKLLK